MTKFLSSVLKFKYRIFTASLQQRLSCVWCQDCHGGNSQWIQRDCDDDSAILPPTTPGPIFPMAAQSVDLNDTATFVDPSWQTWQCFTVTYDQNGRQSTSRGCIPSQGSHDSTCNAVSTPGRVLWCELCDDRNNCNSSSYIYVSTFMLISALLLLVKL